MGQVCLLSKRVAVVNPGNGWWEAAISDKDMKVTELTTDRWRAQKSLLVIQKYAVLN